LVEADPVRAALVIGIVELHVVVFPEADPADVERARWRFGER
jgi:hypothetical protein